MAKHTLGFKEPKTVNGLKTVEPVIERLTHYYYYWNDNLESAVHSFHIQDGNDKTDIVWTISIMPILDCHETACSHKCYDCVHDCWRDSVCNDRARNSAIKHNSQELFWKLILEECIKHNVKVLRINVGGDLYPDDPKWINWLSKQRPKMEIQFFTKCYDYVNDYYDSGHRFRKNVFCLFSEWEGVEMKNPYNFPVSRIWWKGQARPKGFGCPDLCSYCKINKKGCFNRRYKFIVMAAH